MNYFRLSTSTDLKEIGWSDQIQEYIGNYDRWGSNSFSKIRSGEKIDFELELPLFKLEERAKKTDYLSCGLLGRETMLISPKALQIFQELNLDEYQFFPAQVTHKGEVLDYFLLFLPFSQESTFVNWAKTFFDLIIPRKIKDYNLGKIYFKDFDTFYIFWKNFSIGNRIKQKGEFKYAALSVETEIGMIPNRVVLSPGINLDMFRISLIPTADYYVSDNFKKAIEEYKLTGFRFLPLPGNES